MKKLLLLIACVAVSSLSIAQEDQTDSQQRLDDFTAAKKHEVSLDVLAGLAIPSFNPRYEYLLGRYSGVGADVFISLENEEDGIDFYEKFSFNPYYRQYFFSKEDYGAKGFYGEGFLKFYSFEDFVDFRDSSGAFIDTREETYFETAIGVGIGWKWVSDSGFLIDLGFGIGRDLGISDYKDQDSWNGKGDVIVRGGLNFGWRF
jgi:hypothetical protein